MKIDKGFSLQPQNSELKAAQQDAHLKDAAKMYENHFLNEMVKAMRSTVNSDEGFVKPSFAEKIFTEQLDQQYVQGWANKGGIGLADMIYTQIRDRYFGGTPKHFPGQQMLPIGPKRDLHGLPPADSIQMKALPLPANGKLGYRFEISSPSGVYEARAPMPGVVSEVTALDQDWNLLRLDHGRGLTSELTFPGHPADLSLGQSVVAGQKLGWLNPEKPVLAWNIDWPTS